MTHSFKEKIFFENGWNIIEHLKGFLFAHFQIIKKFFGEWVKIRSPLLRKFKHCLLTLNFFSYIFSKMVKLRTAAEEVERVFLFSTLLGISRKKGPPEICHKIQAYLKVFFL